MGSSITFERRRQETAGSEVSPLFGIPSAKVYSFWPFIIPGEFWTMATRLCGESQPIEAIAESFLTPFSFLHCRLLVTRSASHLTFVSRRWGLHLCLRQNTGNSLVN